MPETCFTLCTVADHVATDDKKREIQSGNRDIEEAHELVGMSGANLCLIIGVQLEQMDLDVMDLPAANRGKTKKKIANFKSTLQQAEKDIVSGFPCQCG